MSCDKSVDSVKYKAEIIGAATILHEQAIETVLSFAAIPIIPKEERTQYITEHILPRAQQTVKLCNRILKYYAVLHKNGHIADHRRIDKFSRNARYYYNFAKTVSESSEFVINSLLKDSENNEENRQALSQARSIRQSIESPSPDIKSLLNFVDEYYAQKRSSQSLLTEAL